VQIFIYTVLIIYAVAIAYVTLYCLSQLYLLCHYFRFRRMAKPASPPALPTPLPVVTVQLPIYNEKFVVGRLIDAVCAIDYPKELLEIQVLDDSTDETLELARQKVIAYAGLGVRISLIHRTNRAGFKAGALANGMKTARGAYIAIFDADFVPDRSFLHKTLPWFSGQDICVVQTRWAHLNEKQSILTRLQAFQLNVHFTVEQSGRMHAGFPLQFNGTAGIWRRLAIEEAGGWQSDTLTEDLDLSYRAQVKGWRIKYLEDVTSPAELPAWMPAIKSQQFRWMKGGAETARKALPAVWSSRMTLTQKIMATQHLLSSAIFIGVLLISILSVPLTWFGPLPGVQLKFLSFGLVGLAAVCGVYLVANSTSSWTSDSWWLRFGRWMIYMPLFLGMSMALALHNSIAVLEGYAGKKSSFIRTPKVGDALGRSGKDTVEYVKSRISLITVFEGLLAMYFLAAVIRAVTTGQMAFIVFHLLLTLGYSAIWVYSIRHARSIAQ
jgi:cellulose synthase/poly-beta-1,6-N-acetylglucosamine synthase-like glycosyltransferase